MDGFDDTVLGEIDECLKIGDVPRLVTILQKRVDQTFDSYKKQHNDGRSIRSDTALNWLTSCRLQWRKQFPALDLSPIETLRKESRDQFTSWREKQRPNKRRMKCNLLDVCGEPVVKKATSNPNRVLDYELRWNCAECSAHAQLPKTNKLPDSELFDLEVYDVDPFNNALLEEFGVNEKYFRFVNYPTWLTGIPRDRRLHENVGRHVPLLAHLCNLLHDGNVMDRKLFNRVSAIIQRGEGGIKYAMRRAGNDSFSKQALELQWTEVNEKPVIGHLYIFAGNAKHIMRELLREDYFVLPWSCLCTKNATAPATQPIRVPYSSSWRPLQTAMRRCSLTAGFKNDICERYVTKAQVADVTEIFADKTHVVEEVKKKRQTAKDDLITKGEMRARPNVDATDRRTAMLNEIERKYEEKWDSVQGSHIFHRIHRHMMVVFRSGIVMREFRKRFVFAEHRITNRDRNRTFTASRMELYYGVSKTVEVKPLLSVNAVLNTATYVSNPLRCKFADNDDSMARVVDRKITFDELRTVLYTKEEDAVTLKHESPVAKRFVKLDIDYRVKIWERNHFYFSSVMTQHAVLYVRSKFPDAFVEQCWYGATKYNTNRYGLAVRRLHQLLPSRNLSLVKDLCRDLLGIVSSSRQLELDAVNGKFTVRDLLDKYPSLWKKIVVGHQVPMEAQAAMETFCPTELLRLTVTIDALKFQKDTAAIEFARKIVDSSDEETAYRVMEEGIASENHKRKGYGISHKRKPLEGNDLDEVDF